MEGVAQVSFFWPDHATVESKSLDAVSNMTSLSQPWRVAGDVVSPDPGMPLIAYSQNFTLWSQQPSLRKVIDFIASNVSAVPLKIMRDTANGAEEVTDGPVWELLRQPRLMFPAQKFWYDWLTDFLIYDRTMAQLNLNADAPSGYELKRWPTFCWRFTQTDYTDTDGIDIVLPGSHGAATSFPLSGLLFDEGYGASNGVAPAVTLSQTLQEYTESVKWRRSLWKRMARIPGIWTHDQAVEQPLSDTARARLEADLSNYVDGGGMEGKSPVLESVIKWNEIKAFSPKETQEVEGRTLTDIEVASAYRVPPEMVGARQANYGSTQAFRDALYRETLGPTFRRIEGCINAQIVPYLQPDDHIRVAYDMDSALDGSFLEKAEVISSSVGGPWMSVDEGRRRDGLPSKGGAYDDILTPLNTVRGGGTQASPHDSGSQNITNGASL